MLLIALPSAGLSESSGRCGRVGAVVAFGVSGATGSVVALGDEAVMSGICREDVVGAVLKASAWPVARVGVVGSSSKPELALGPEDERPEKMSSQSWGCAVAVGLVVEG